MLGPNKPSIPGVGKFRKNIKKLKKQHPIRNHSLFISWEMGVSEDFGENNTVFSGNKKGFRV